MRIRRSFTFLLLLVIFIQNLRGGHKKPYIKSAAQQSATIFSTNKSAAQNEQFNFLISEEQRNFRNELFHSVEAQRNFATAEWHFCIKLKRNLTSATEISQHNANIAFFAILGKKSK